MRIGDSLHWPTVEVMLFLKSRKRTISLHEMCDFIGMDKAPNFSYQVLLGDAEAIAVRLRESVTRKTGKDGRYTSWSA